MFGLFKKKKQCGQDLIGEEINQSVDREFRQQANQRIRELEEKFDMLCGHLGVRVYKPYHYVVENGAALGRVTHSVAQMNAGSMESAKKAR